MRGPAGAGDDDLKTALFGLSGIIKRALRRAVRRDHGDLIGNKERIQNVRSSGHDSQIALTAHDDADQWFFHFAPPVMCGRRIKGTQYLIPAPAMVELS